MIPSVSFQTPDRLSISYETSYLFIISYYSSQVRIRDFKIKAFWFIESWFRTYQIVLENLSLGNSLYWGRYVSHNALTCDQASLSFLFAAGRYAWYNYLTICLLLVQNLDFSLIGQETKGQSVLTDRIEIHQLQPLVWPCNLFFVMLSGCDWWISIRSTKTVVNASLESFVHKALKDEQIECIHRIVSLFQALCQCGRLKKRAGDERDLVEKEGTTWEPVSIVLKTSFRYTSSWYTLWLVTFDSSCQHLVCLSETKWHFTWRAWYTRVISRSQNLLKRSEWSKDRSGPWIDFGKSLQFFLEVTGLTVWRFSLLSACRFAEFDASVICNV